MCRATEAQIQTHAAAAGAGQFLLLQLEGRTQGPGVAQVAGIADAQFGLRILEIVVREGAAVVTPLDAVDAEAAEAEGEGAQLPAGQDQAALLLVEADPDQIGVGGLQAHPFAARQAGRIPEQGGPVVDHGPVGAAQAQGPLARAPGEDRAAAAVIGRLPGSRDPQGQHRADDRDDAAPRAHRTTATLRRNRAWVPLVNSTTISAR